MSRSSPDSADIVLRLRHLAKLLGVGHFDIPARLNEAAGEIERLRATQSAAPDLTDPVVVHMNMLRGTIAKPSWESIKHLYPEQFTAPAMAQSDEGEKRSSAAIVRPASVRQAEDALKDWLNYAEANLSEFDVEDGDCNEDKLCPKCENSGCIQYKIRETRIALSSLECDHLAQPSPVAWRYRNEYGEVVSEWIDGPPPEYVRDANTDERIAVSTMKIDVAYSRSSTHSNTEAGK